MTKVCHLFDGSAGWEQRVGVLQLIDRMPHDRFCHTLAAIDRAAVTCLSPCGQPVEMIARCGGLGLPAAPGVARFVARRRFDLIHVWGLEAAVAARAASRTPVVIELFDPVLVTRHIKMIRTLARPKGFSVICGSGIVRRRLVEGGVALESCVVIRPGVDFALINRWRRGKLRKQLGTGRHDYLITVPEPLIPSGGQLEAYLAVAIMNHLDGGVRIVVPGNSRELKRIRRFADALIGRPALVETDEGTAFEELVSTCDALVVTSRGDISTTPIAWAMAAETTVIGSAVPSVAELIADKVNGLLFKQLPGKSAAASIFRLLQDRKSQARVTEVARAHAYEMFSVRRYVDEHLRVYDNVLNRARPGDIP